MMENSPIRSEVRQALPTSVIADAPEVPPHHSIMGGIYGVGAEKPLGYLLVETMRRYGEDPYHVSDLSQQRGLSTLSVPEEVSRTPGGALYVYDNAALAYLLKIHQKLLDRSDWPNEPALFVDRVVHEAVDSKRNPELFTLIAWAFKDPRREYQRPNPEATITSCSFKHKILGRLGLGRRAGSS